MSVAAAAGRVPSASLLPSGRWLPTEARPPPPPAGGALQPAAVQEVLAFLFFNGDRGRSNSSVVISCVFGPLRARFFVSCRTPP